jgi:hypothetical protein
MNVSASNVLIASMMAKVMMTPFRWDGRVHLNFRCTRCHQVWVTPDRAGRTAQLMTGHHSCLDTVFNPQKRLEVRIRITQPLSGSIDGIQLSRFAVGVTYEVGTTLASYLLAEGLGEPVDPSTREIVSPIRDESQVIEVPAKWQNTPAKSDDRSRRKPRTSTK